MISVSIVAYETPADDLRALLQGLLRSPRRQPRVLVVDNSPTEALRPTVENAGATYLPAGDNLGFAAGHNLALQELGTDSRYHLVCNPDIVCEPEVLWELADFMDASPDVGLAMPRVLYRDGREQRLCKLLPGPTDLLVRRFLGGAGERLLRRRWDRYEMRAFDLEIPREVPSLSGCFMFLRTAVVREVGLFDPRFFMYMEDVDLCRRVGAVARTVFFPQATVVHGYAKGSYHDRRLLLYHLGSAVRYFNKWGWLRDRERRQLNARTEVWSDGGEVCLSGGAAAAGGNLRFGREPAGRRLRGTAVSGDWQSHR